ncbi:hypothetical protein O0I10_011262 [Lichtheimia ornata]|uniref:Fanconi anaemia group A protein helical domain-containing protein n=1 Tax=Lichtheimia ornata TaxID=688661 RepID=A0AAD7XUB5_9FUNG|nr:uncharacterized protein O0I10_011262 [Lichtheimia ornata]KAJ8653121.1 hypothetical protein O0I10_011262 [Lichtheimia ornata]
MSFIQPFRTKVIKQGTISKTIRGRSSSASTSFRHYSTKQLAKDFAQSVNNRNGTIQDDLIFALCMLKRQLTFSSSVFVSHWLKHLDQSIDPTPLVAFYRLASRLTSILSLSCLLQQADSEWVCSQCCMLLKAQQIDVLADYLEAMMSMGDSIGLIWLNRLCAKDRNDYCSCRPVQSPSMLITSLQVLQDPKKIPRLPMNKRRDIVIQFMQHVEETPDISDWGVMKKRLWHGAMRWKDDSLSHLLASWYAECGSLEWPRLSLLLLTQKPTLPLLLIYIGACQQLQQASHLARAAELLGSLDTSLRNILSRGLPRQEFQMLLMLVQICLSYLSELLGMSYQGWFQHKFLDPKTTCFENNKGAFDSFITLLEEMIPTEMPAILQIQGKAMNNANQQGPPRQYVSMVKTRLMELGVDHTLRQYPLSLQHPLLDSQTQEMATSSSSRSSSVEDIIEHAMDLFERDQCIPKDLWENAIFKPRWFKMTFLPAFIVYPHRKHTRDGLIAALHDKKKIPPNTYKEYLRMK